jgi:putative membrane protein
MFFTHRLQHLVLHHAAPFLIALAAPWPVLAAGLPASVRERWLPAFGRNRALRELYRALQNPVVAPVLFVGLIYFWLIPSIHFDAMLSRWLYEVMNWSMLIDGLLFWWLILDPVTRKGGLARLGFGARMVILWLVTVPQIALGAYIALSNQVLFDVYDVCGRAWPLAPLTDQQIGGLVTWIPAAMMSVLGALVLIGYWLHGRGDSRAEGKPSMELGGTPG